MEILLWLVPSAVVTVVAMVWVAVAGRERSTGIDRDEAVRRMGVALRKPARQRYAGRPHSADRSTGIAVRPSRAPERPDDPKAAPQEATESVRRVS